MSAAGPRSVNHQKSPIPAVVTPETSPRIGWREWVSFSEWGIAYLKAKVDTGARTSSLHVENLEWLERDGIPWVRFEVKPWQRSSSDSVFAEAMVTATRNVRSSSGTVDHRPAIQATISIAGVTILAELTLTSRDEMGFRMLLGRQAIRGRFVVDPAVSYLGGRPDRASRQKNRGVV